MFAGFILIFLDFNLNIGESKIDLIPDFLGYIIMIRGLLEMADESIFFKKVRPYLTVMVGFSGVLYLLDMLGVSASLGVLNYVLGLLYTVLSLYISYNIVMGVVDIEGIYDIFLNGSNLKFIWTLYAVLSVLTFVLLIIPPFAIVCMIVTFIVSICFLVAFNNSKNLYYNAIK